jgi:D-ribose pyranase
MRTSGVIHPELVELLAAAGHGDRIVLADAGLRVPRGARRIDIGLTAGVPTMAQVLDAVIHDLVVESAEVATEFAEWSPETHAGVVDLLGFEPVATRTHVDLMADMAATAYAYVKTGDCSAYSSVVLTCGVSFLDDAIAHYAEVHGRPPAM